MVGRLFAVAVLCACVVEYSARRPIRALLARNALIDEYEVVFPRVIERSDDNEHPEELGVELEVNGEAFILQLQLNKNVLGRGFKHGVQHDSDNHTVYKDAKNCYYQGRVVDRPNWIVSVSVCYGLRGYFGRLSSRNETYIIEPMDQKTLSAAHLVYMATEQPDSHFGGECGTEGRSKQIHEVPSSLPMERKRLRRQSGNSPYTLELYVVTDVAAVSYTHLTLPTIYSV